MVLGLIYGCTNFGHKFYHECFVQVVSQFAFVILFCWLLLILIAKVGVVLKNSGNLLQGIFRWPHLTSLDLIWPHLTLPDLIWPHMISCELTWPKLTSCDLIWPFLERFSAILPTFQIMRCEFCIFCMEPLQPTQGSWLVPLGPPKSPKRGPF